MLASWLLAGVYTSPGGLHWHLHATLEGAPIWLPKRRAPVSLHVCVCIWHLLISRLAVSSPLFISSKALLLSASYKNDHHSCSALSTVLRSARLSLLCVCHWQIKAQQGLASLYKGILTSHGLPWGYIHPPSSLCIIGSHAHVGMALLGQ